MEITRLSSKVQVHPPGNYVIGCTGYKGKKKSLKDMKEGIMQRAKKHKR